MFLYKLYDFFCWGGARIAVTKATYETKQLIWGLSFVLDRTVQRQHNHSNSYKGKGLVKADSQFQRFSPFSHGGKHIVMVLD